MAGKKLGFNAKLWVKDGETDISSLNLAGAAPTGATEWKDVTDVTVNDSYTEVDATTRRLAGTKGYKQGLRDISLEVPVKKDAGDAAYAIVKAAMDARTPITVYYLDGPVTSDDSEGVAFIANVFGGNEEQPLDDLVGATLTIKPTDSEYPPIAISGTT